MTRESAKREGRHEPGASFVQRATRLARRIGNRKVWRSVLLGLTDPTNDSHWQFIVKRGTDRYLSSPQPWFAPGAVERLEGVVATEAEVFEWGAGASTLWFLSRGCKVVSFETDRSWIELLDPQIQGRARIELVTPTEERYCRPELDGFEIIVIDGRSRNVCALHTADVGPAGACVVFDDSHRVAYQEGVHALGRRATRQWHYPGLSASLTPKLTSVFELGDRDASASANR